MKIPDVYRDWRIMFGLALMLLGTGNWVVGWEKTQLYGQLIASGAREAKLRDDVVLDGGGSRRREGDEGGRS